MKKGCVQAAVFHQRWCKGMDHIKLLIWLGVEGQVRVEGEEDEEEEEY